MYGQDEQAQIESLGQRMAAFRRNLKMSQVEFAEKVGISRGTLKKYEQGEVNPSATALLRFAAIGADVSWLLLGEYEAERMRNLTVFGENAHRIPVFEYASELVSEPAMWLGNSLARPLLSDWQTRGQARLLMHQVADDSMQPTVSENEFALIDPDVKSGDYNGVYLIKNGHSLKIRRLQADLNGGYYFRADNPLFPIEHIGVEAWQSVEVIGEVIAVFGILGPGVLAQK